MDMITVKVKLFAIYQEVYGQEEISFDVPIKTTAEEILDKIITQHPQLANWKPITKLAVNLEFVPPEYILKDGDEMGLIPPVSGG